MKIVLGLTNSMRALQTKKRYTQSAPEAQTLRFRQNIKNRNMHALLTRRPSPSHLSRHKLHTQRLGLEHQVCFLRKPTVLPGFRQFEIEVPEGFREEETCLRHEKSTGVRGQCSSSSLLG